MESSYEKAYKVLQHINDNMISSIDDAYREDSKKIENIVINSECLNRSRSITNVAVECLNDGYANEKYKNHNIESSLEELKSLAKQLDMKSSKMNDLNTEFEAFYYKKRSEISKMNVDLLEELNRGTTNGLDLLDKVAVLGKMIESFLNEEMEQYIIDTKVFIEATEDYYCSEIEEQYRKINAIDNSLLGRIRDTMWTQLRFGSLMYRGAYGPY